ncbi:MAG: hypothetical protein AVDCRST_MAG10-2752, partial [uncultured Acidimicrobiales bacterium]
DDRRHGGGAGNGRVQRLHQTTIGRQAHRAAAGGGRVRVVGSRPSLPRLLVEAGPCPAAASGAGDAGRRRGPVGKHTGPGGVGEHM